MRLAGKSAVVTGGGRGLGRAIAEAFAAEGATVGIHYGQNPSEAQDVVDQIRAAGGAAQLFQADVRVQLDVKAMFVDVAEAFGKLDVLVNNAGIMRSTPFLEITSDEWDDVITTNLRGYFFCGQEAGKMMAARGDGSIINISSTRQVQSWPGNAHYCASKGAIFMLNRVMALELAPQGVRVNAIAPGTIETDLNRATLADEKFRRTRVQRIPVGRIGAPHDVAEAAIYLASDGSRFTNGASLMIDGGQTIW